MAFAEPRTFPDTYLEVALLVGTSPDKPIFGITDVFPQIYVSFAANITSSMEITKQTIGSKPILKGYIVPADFIDVIILESSLWSWHIPNDREQ